MTFVNATIVLGLTRAYSGIHKHYYRSFKIKLKIKKVQWKKKIQKGHIVKKITQQNIKEIKIKKDLWWRSWAYSGVYKCHYRSFKKKKKSPTRKKKFEDL